MRGKPLAYVTIVLLACRLQAMNLYQYDLESLVFASDEIARGSLGAADNVGQAATTQQLIVERTFKGSHQRGDVIHLTAINFFVKPGKTDFDACTDLVQGDDVIAFLAPAREDMFNRIPKGAEVYWPVFAGLKVVANGKVCSFMQGMNPGPYVMDRPRTPGLPSPDEFDRQINEALTRVGPIKEKIRTATTRESGGLVELLAARRSPTYPQSMRRDAIAESACKKLVEIHDWSSLDQAICTQRGWFEEEILQDAYASRDGQEHLLARLEDPATPHVDRPQLAKAVRGQAMRHNNDLPPPRSCERMARLGLQFTHDGDTAAAVALFQNVNRLNYGENGEKDLAAALHLLLDSYPTIDEPHVRYAIDKAIIMAPENLQLKSPVGYIATLTRAATAADHYLVKKGELIYVAEFASALHELKEQVEVSVVLQNLSSGRDWIIPTKHPLSGISGGCGGSIKIPADLLPGRYKIRLRLSRKSEIIGDGEATEFDFPIPSN